jgi:hypothetical protein
MSNFDLDYDILQIDYWEDSNQWTVLVENFQKFDLETIIRDIGGNVSRCHQISEFKFMGGYFDIVEVELTQEFDSTIFENFSNFLDKNELKIDISSLNKMTVRSFSLTFSF